MLARGLACATAPCVTGVAAAADDARFIDIGRQLAQVQAQLQQLAQENRSLREHQQQIERQLAQLTAQPRPLPAPGRLIRPASTVDPRDALRFAACARPEIVGYGEMYYTDPRAMETRHRPIWRGAVFGLGYSFDERTEFNSEYEVEHAVASASDAGEFEVEQFYVDRRPERGGECPRRSVPDALRVAQRVSRAHALLRTRAAPTSSKP